MRFTKWLKTGLIGLTFAALAGVVIAQTISLPFVTTINPTADAIQIVPRSQPSAQSVYATPSQVTSQGYQTVVNTGATTAQINAGTAYTYTMANYQQDMLFDFGGSTISYVYLTFAPNPSDGARECFFSSGTVTAAYLSANSGQTLSRPVTAFTANTRYCWDYSVANLTWTRSN